jgi:hypothetical protein
MNIYHSSPISESNVSFHLLDGIIPINIDSDVKINLQIGDLEFLSQNGLDLNVDFNKWRKAVFDFQLSTIQRDMKGTIFSSLQVVDVFFYDSEDQCFSIEKHSIEENIDNILENWKKRLNTNLKSIEKRLENCFLKSEKEIALSINKNTLELNGDLYKIEIKKRDKLFKTIEQYTNEYIDNSIAFHNKRRPLDFDLSLEEFKNRFNKLLHIKEPTTTDILSFLEWTCSSLNIEVEDY